MRSPWANGIRVSPGPCMTRTGTWICGSRARVSYRMRAEIPGFFSALPTKASAMYAPELKANSDEIRLRIED